MKLINGDCMEEINKINIVGKILVIDPPFNIGYKYHTYTDNKGREEYLEWINNITSMFDEFVIIHYPEDIFEISLYINKIPRKTVSWVYNSNTKRQHRMVAYFGVNPIFSQVKQPYKNPNDKRIKEKIKNGSKGTDIYDWWYFNQVKNVSKEKTKHPCQMPLSVMKNVIGILPKEKTIIDCFMGSGTTGVACKELNRDFIGIEIDEQYFEIAKERIKNHKIQESFI